MNIALILAGGTGLCYGYCRPQQYISLKGKMIITYVLEAIAAHPKIAAIQVVADKEWRDEVYKQMTDPVLRKFAGFSDPGSSRQRSILQGLDDMADYARKSDLVIIHDAIRPMVKEEQITACLKACKVHEGVAPVLPVTSRIFIGEDGAIKSIADQDKMFLVQTPEVFQLGRYYKAIKRLKPVERLDEVVNSVEPAILDGMDIAMIPGDEDNFAVDCRRQLERLKGVLHYWDKELA